MRVGWLLVGGLVAVLLAGCGGGGGTEEGEAAQLETVSAPQGREVWVSLDGWETAETLGLVMAEKRGNFEEANLEVATLAPVSSTRSIHYVVTGGDLIGVAHGPQVVWAKSKGAAIVIIGSLVSHSTAALIWPRRSGIDGIADLEGKTIAIPGLEFQRLFLERILARAGLAMDDVEVRTVGNDLVPELVEGRADAIFGGSANVEGADLAQRGLRPVITTVRELGFPDYDELVLVARTNRTKETPDLMRDFAAAVAAGADAAVEQPQAARRALGKAGEKNPETSPKARAVEVRRTLPLLSRTGKVDPARLKRLVEWMHSEGMIRRQVPVRALLAGSQQASAGAGPR